METREEHSRDTKSARSGLVELGGQIVGGYQVVFGTVETGCCYDLHSCMIDDGTRNKAN